MSDRKPKRRRGVPCVEAQAWYPWNAELEGRRADPGRARSLAAFVSELLTVDETDDEAVLTLLDRHYMSHRRDSVTAEDRALIRGARAFIANLHLGLKHTDASRKPRQIAVAAVRAIDKEQKIQRHPTGKRIAIVRALEAFVRGEMEHPDFTEIQVLTSDLIGLSHLFCGCAAIEQIASRLRSGKIKTVQLAAAKMTRAAGLFGDDARPTRDVRQCFDSAIRNALKSNSGLVHGQEDTSES